MRHSIVDRNAKNKSSFWDEFENADHITVHIQFDYISPDIFPKVRSFFLLLNITTTNNNEQRTTTNKDSQEPNTKPFITTYFSY